ncbi:MAG: LysR family transcriptional regulator [Erysipelotrichaceae bacterium]|nr:LysR family transcriptional regulator [Erysipelotrichaceae bacterium]
MTIEQLKYFIDVAETKNMTISAAKFYISTQGLSRSLKALQQELQTELLRFSKGKLELTEDGLVYYTRIKDLVLKIEEINNDFIQTKTVKISVGVSSYTYKLVSTLLEQYQKEHPEHLLLITEYPDKATEQKLVEEKIDIAFISGPVFSKELKYVTIAEADDYLCLPQNHPLASKDTISFNDIKDEPFISMNENFKIHDCYVSHMNYQSCSPKIVFSAASLEAIENTLKIREAITMGNPQYDIYPEGYIKVPMKDKGKWKLHIAVHNANSCVAVNSLFEYVIKHIDKLNV